MLSNLSFIETVNTSFHSPTRPAGGKIRVRVMNCARGALKLRHHVFRNPVLQYLDFKDLENITAVFDFC